MNTLKDNSLTRSLLAMAMLLMCVVASLAQTGSGGGTIQGTVKDESGATLPGAKVKITNLATGITTNTVTSESGVFITPTINIGKYKVRIEANGMKAWEGETQVETAREATIEPILKIGDVSETVVVEGNLSPLGERSDLRLSDSRIVRLPGPVLVVHSDRSGIQALCRPPRLGSDPRVRGAAAG